MSTAPAHSIDTRTHPARFSAHVMLIPAQMTWPLPDRAAPNIPHDLLRRLPNTLRRLDTDNAHHLPPADAPAHPVLLQAHPCPHGNQERRGVRGRVFPRGRRRRGERAKELVG